MLPFFVLSLSMVFLLATGRQLLLTMEQRSWTTSIEEPHEMEQPAPTKILKKSIEDLL
jgi:hypothetical protein